MPLAALIVAQDETDIGDGLRATLPLAGRTLVEYQADIMLHAGASHAVLLVERVPAALAQAVDRLRRQGMRIEIARSVADAIDRFHPDEHILLVADGAVVAQGAVDMLAGQPVPSLLTLPDVDEYAMFERIDATQRWAGVALVDRAALDGTARILGDWDLSSTLLRRLVQSEALRIDALDPGGGLTVMPPVLAIGPASIGPLEASLLRRAAPGGGDWTERYLHRLLAAPLIDPLVARQVDQRHVALVGVALAWVGALFAAFHLFWAAALLLPLAAAVASAARRMARIWGGDSQTVPLIDIARHAAAIAVLILLTRMLTAEGSWGWWTIAASLPASLLGIAALAPIVAALRGAPAPRALASADALLWIAPPLALLGGWRWMVMALAGYAALSFGQRFMAAWKAARICDNGV